MTRPGIEVLFRNPPPLDPGFLPLARFQESFLRTACQPFHIAVERPDGVAARHTLIHGTADRFDADVFYICQLARTLLWTCGGFRVYLAGDRAVCRAVENRFASGGRCAFDADFMAGIYHTPFEVRCVDRVPEPWDSPRSVGGHTGGCRIGFDAGGSDRKSAAVMDGQVVYTEEVPWTPKEHADPAYHYAGIVSGLRSAAAHLPRVDAVGISTAGICADDRLLRSALFEKVPRNRYEPGIYRRAVNDLFGPVPCAVVNDGDVSALAGAAMLGETDVLGLAMGTSLAAGYVDGAGRITSWLNELAFVPIDADPAAPVDPWSGHRGCGVSCLSQEAVIRLAHAADIPLAQDLTPAEKLAAVQALAQQDDPRANAVFDTVGLYLAHALAQYHGLYHFRHVLLLGRVTSGRGGERVLANCLSVLAAEYPDLASAVALHLPREDQRRTGQAISAAFLPELCK